MVPPPEPPDPALEPSLFEALFAAAPQPMWVHDPEGSRLLTVNRAAEDLFGRPRAALLAMRPAELEAVAAVLALEVSAHPIEWSGGETVLYVATRTGVGALEVPTDLPRLQAWFRRALESAQDGLLMVDREWRVTYLNPEGERLLSATRDQLLHHDLWGAMPHLAGGIIESRARQALENDAVEEFEERFLPDSRTLSFRAYPTIQGLALFLRDVTERREAEAALRHSEERFRYIARATADAIWDWDLRAHTVWWGEGIRTLSGFDASEMEPDSSSWTNRLHPEDRDRVVSGIERVIHEGGTEWSDEYRFRNRDGSYSEVADQGFVIRDSSGLALRMVGGMRDLSERLRAQEQIRLQATLLESVSQSIIATAEDGTIVYWNAAAETLYGWTAEEAMGQPIALVTVSSQSREEALAIMERLGAGESWSGDFEVRRKDGSTFVASVSNFPILGPDGAFRGVIGISSDATERLELDRRLHQAQKMEAVGRLAGGIAHDFNNVLTVILGRARLLLDDLAEDSPIREDLEQIVSGAQRAASLTSRLLAFGRVQFLQEAVVDLAVAAEEMLPLLTPVIPGRIEFRFENAATSPWVKVDLGQLHQVLLNLTINARDAIEGEGVITLRVEEREYSPEEVAILPWQMAPGPYVLVSVEDTGSGIPPELMDRIFEPFFTTKAEGQGTGLGLSMVYGLMKQSRGWVQVESEVGRGSVFRLLFPAVDEAVEGERSEPAPLELVNPPIGGRILLVDDDAAVGGVMTRLLKRAGYVVFRARNGREAFEMIQEAPGLVDLVVTDLVMPELGGAGLLVLLRESGFSLPVILLSGYSEEELPAETRKEAASFLKKPFSPNELTDAVRAALSRPGFPSPDRRVPGG